MENDLFLNVLGQGGVLGGGDTSSSACLQALERARGLPPNPIPGSQTRGSPTLPLCFSN